MSQQQCPHCGHCGPRYTDDTPSRLIPAAHSDGSKCRCSHVTAGSRLGAIDAGGRYYDHNAGRWLCFGCGTTRVIDLDEVRALERGFSLFDEIH